eukprot:IDg1725t1
MNKLPCGQIVFFRICRRRHILIPRCHIASSHPLDGCYWWLPERKGCTHPVSRHRLSASVLLFIFFPAYRLSLDDFDKDRVVSLLGLALNLSVTDTALPTSLCLIGQSTWLIGIVPQNSSNCELKYGGTKSCIRKPNMLSFKWALALVNSIDPTKNSSLDFQLCRSKTATIPFYGVVAVFKRLCWSIACRD